MGYDCVMTSETGGICFPQGTSSGCCQASGTPWGPGVFAIVFGLVVLRRRSNRSRR